MHQGRYQRGSEVLPPITRPGLIEDAKLKLEDAENRRTAQDVARTWKQLEKLTRVEETMLLTELRGYQKLGLTFCVGFSDEVQMLTNVFLNEGFKIVSVTCMCGAISSDDMGLPEEDKTVEGFRQP